MCGPGGYRSSWMEPRPSATLRSSSLRGTPTRRGDGHANLSCAYAATAEEIAGLIQNFTVIVTKSTVPVGTGDEVEAIRRRPLPGAPFAVVSSPEFLLEGAVIEDFKRPDRLVIGVGDERAKAAMAELYRPISLNEVPVIYTSRRTSEWIEYAVNGFLAMKITFINKMADLCEKVGADIQQLAKRIGLDGRIGAKPLNPGPGYCGSCFAKDTLAFVRTARDYKAPVRLIETTVEVDDARKVRVAEKIRDATGGEVCGKTVAILGLTFKPNTDDMSDSPSLVVIPALQAMGARIRAFDPAGMNEARHLLKDVAFTESAYQAAEGADVLVILREWDQFRALNLGRMKELMNRARMVDLRNISRLHESSSDGFDYVGIGKP